MTINLQTYGIDVSSYSLDVDWTKVVANLNPRFIFARAYHMAETAAECYADSKFANDYWPSLGKLKLPRGAYLFCHPKADAADSIERFFSVYKPQSGDLVPTLDIEDIYDSSCGVPLQDRIAQISTMIELVAKKMGGQKPIIYTKKRVWNELGNPAQFADCPLWVLNYQTMPTPLNMPQTWPTFAFWQYAENIKNVDGIGGDFDPNLFNGPESDLAKYFIKHVAV
jgi:GH25 family lysozyme M1 (1,4-beta-N-acetylmuramidase)